MARIKSRRKKKDIFKLAEMEASVDEKVRHLYMLFLEPNEIAELLDMSLFEVHSKIQSQNLKDEREKHSNEFIAKCIASQQNVYGEIISLSAESLRRWLSDLCKSERKMSVKDAKMLSDLVANVHRISQLERNLPTAINRAENVSVSDVKSALADAIDRLRQVDPFVSYQEASDSGSDDSSKIN